MVEILAVATIALILVGVLLNAYQSMVDKSAMVREVGAARNLIAAHLNYSAENNGAILPGQKEVAGTLDRNGNELKMFMSKRWVLRLAPYFDYQFPGTVVVNETLREYREMSGKKPIQGLEADVYVASIGPSLGMNSTFVGGNYNAILDEAFSTDPTVASESVYGKFYVSHISQVAVPSKMIVFASARYRDANNNRTGNEHIFAPRISGDLRWNSSFDPAGNSAASGHVDARWEGKAVAAQMDGSVALLNFQELQDMRRWSNQAAEADDPNWTLRTPQ